MSLFYFILFFYLFLIFVFSFYIIFFIFRKGLNLSDDKIEKQNKMENLIYLQTWHTLFIYQFIKDQIFLHNLFSCSFYKKFISSFKALRHIIVNLAKMLTFAFLKVNLKIFMERNNYELWSCLQYPRLCSLFRQFFLAYISDIFCTLSLRQFFNFCHSL